MFAKRARLFAVQRGLQTPQAGLWLARQVARRLPRPGTGAGLRRRDGPTWYLSAPPGLTLHSGPTQLGPTHSSS